MARTLKMAACLLALLALLDGSAAMFAGKAALKAAPAKPAVLKKIAPAPPLIKVQAEKSIVKGLTAGSSVGSNVVYAWPFATGTFRVTQGYMTTEFESHHAINAIDFIPLTDGERTFCGTTNNGRDFLPACRGVTREWNPETNEDQRWPITAVADGTVFDVNVDCKQHHETQGSCHENYVWIDHGDGTWSEYAHIDSFLGDIGTHPGQKVKAGEPIAFLGLTGAFGPHLHFSVHKSQPGDICWPSCTHSQAVEFFDDPTCNSKIAPFVPMTVSNAEHALHCYKNPGDIDPIPKTCLTVQENNDIWGVTNIQGPGPQGGFTANNQAECQTMCTQDDRCKAWVYAGSLIPTMRCWLKEGTGFFTPMPNVNAGQCTDPPTDIVVKTCTTEQANMDIPINNLPDGDGIHTGWIANNKAECQGKCAANPDCEAWVYDGSFDIRMRCWLKASKGSFVTKPGVFAGHCTESSLPVKTCTTEQADNDISAGNLPGDGSFGGFSANDKAECQAKCVDEPDCKGWVYDKALGVDHRCWLKSSPGTFVGKDGVVSGQC